MKKRLYQIAFWSAITVIMALAVTPQGVKLARHMSDKLNHFAAFLVLSYLGDRAYEKPFVSIGICLVLFGLFIEAIQFFLPYRKFSPLDMLANICGILLYAAIKYWVESFRGKTSAS